MKERSKRGRKTKRRHTGFLRPVPLLVFALASLLTTVAVGVFLAPEVDDRRLLARGNEAFRTGDLVEAIEHYDEDGEKIDLFTRKFNAALAHRQAGDLDEAITRLEEVATDGEEELRPRALFLLGNCHIGKGNEQHRSAYAEPEANPNEPPPEVDESTQLQERLTKLGAAAGSFQRACEFYRDVEPRDLEVKQNLQVAKTSLRQVRDEIARIEEEMQRKKEDDALEEPAQLLPQLIQQEKAQRILARATAQQSGRGRRLGSRSLRKKQVEIRSLTDRLVHYVRRQVEEHEKKPQDAQKEDAGKMDGWKKSIPVLTETVEAQKQSEIAYLNLEPDAADEHHGTAITRLRHARAFFGIDIESLAREAHERTKQIVELSNKLDEVDSGGLSGEIEGSGIGKTIVQALKDRVLQPIARMLTPSQKSELTMIAEELDDVIWGAQVLSVVEAPTTLFATSNTAPGAPGIGSGGGQAPGGTPDAEAERKTKEFNELMHSEAKTALEAATTARTHLLGEKLVDAIPQEETALAALARIVDALPEPPEQPEDIRQRLEKLTERQRLAADASRSLETTEPTTRESAARELASSQAEDSKEAQEIETELSTQPDSAQAPGTPPAGDPREAEKRKEAAKLVATAATHIDVSSLTLGENRPAPATTSIDSAVEALEEALALLEKEEEEQEQEEQQQQQEDGYQIPPRQARMLKEEMDRKRREELERIFVPSDSFTVEKDW